MGGIERGSGGGEVLKYLENILGSSLVKFTGGKQNYRVYKSC